MPRIELLFFEGSGLPGAIVRLGTHSLYAHVAIHISGDGFDYVYEAVAPRVLRRNYNASLPFSPDRLARHVALPAECDLARNGSAISFLETCVGEPYDWLAIAFDVAGFCLPSWIALRDDSHRRWDCSRLAAAVLSRLGYRPEAIADLHAPVSPGDLYRLLTTGTKTK